MMELGLSLGEASRPFGFMEKPLEGSNQLGLGFNTTLSIGPLITEQRDQHQEQEETPKQKKHNKHNIHSQRHNTTEDDHEATNEYLISLNSLKVDNNAVLHQLDLLLPTPAAAAPILSPSQLCFPWQENGSRSRGMEVNKALAEAEAEEGPALSSSPNSAALSFQMDLCVYNRGGGSMSGEGYDQRGCSRASDEDENGGSTRKKLRLSKEQSAFLEESFKEHSTLNPKQKLALAKQLHLRPRQVEVWFQNRRARTKLKQTEVDCEYLKRCCETLTEENRRLHKEIQELRALKSSNPFYMQLPATTLTMCPSCERVGPNSTSSTSPATFTSANTGSIVVAATAKINNETTTSKSNGLPLGKLRFHPFSHTQSHPHQSSSS